MSTPPPLNTRLAQAIVAARDGYAMPAAMGDGPLGRLFERRMQADIAGALSPEAHGRYAHVRDAVRDAVRLARSGDLVRAEDAFARCETLVAEHPARRDAEDEHLALLCRSWLDQGYAFLAMRRGDAATADARLLAAMSADERLERDHGHALLHIGRVHTVHLWLRLRAGMGELETALDCAERVLSYVNGSGAQPPVGSGWSARAAADVPADLRAAMTCRIGSECGVLLAPLAPAAAQEALRAVPALTGIHDALTRDAASDRDLVAGAQEVRDWAICKAAWCDGDSDRFLILATAFLRAGRRQTSLWYATLLDLCRAAAALRPGAARPFLAETAGRARCDTGPAEVLPSPLRSALGGLDRTPPPVRFRHRPRPRRFHLICIGLPRSGTTSLYTLFARHRAGNEHAETATIADLVARAEGRMADAELDRRLARRDAESRLEMDATSFLHLALDRLPHLFPDAMLVLPVRDPATWLDSYLRMLLRWHAHLAGRGRPPPPWMAAYGRALFGHFDWAEIATPEARAHHLPDVARRFLAHWASATARSLDLSPEDRRLILRTEDLSRRLPDLAAFAGVPLATLTRDHHSNASPPGKSPLRDLDAAMLTRLVDELCGPVLQRLHPAEVPA